MKKKVALVGLGQIGMMYDINKSSSYILSYCKALQRSKYLEFIATVDIDKKKRILFEKKYNLKTFDTIDNLLKNLNPDIIIISTPTRTHFDLLKRLIKFNKKIIVICEKPITDSYKKIKKIEKLVKDKNIKIFTNYMRLSDPKLIYIKNFIKNNNKSNFFCEVFYNGTLLNSCSHYISLILNIFGNKFQFKTLNKNQNYFDFKLVYKNAEIIFYSSSLRNINYEDIRIINKNGIFSYKNGGSELVNERSVINPVYGKGNHYLFSKKINNDFYKQPQKFTINEIENLFFKNKKNSIANLKHAISIHYLIKKIYEKKK